MLSDIEEDIDSGVHRDDCIEKVQKVKRSVKYRSKLIRMADQEEGGWETVKAYERSSIADDDKDDQNIKNAVATAKGNFANAARRPPKISHISHLHYSDN